MFNKKMKRGTPNDQTSETVWNYLSQHSPYTFSAKDLSTALDIPRKSINHALYAMATSHTNLASTNDLPPKWYIVFPERDESPKALPRLHERNKTMVYIDLGNVHDSFKRACRYAVELPDIFVTGAADPNYNHWTPPDMSDDLQLDKTNATLPVVRFFKSQQGLKDAAELMLFAVAISDVLMHGQDIEQIILCSKDNAVDTMRHILDTYMSQSKDIQVHLCRNWTELYGHLRLLE